MRALCSEFSSGLKVLWVYTRVTKGKYHQQLKTKLQEREKSYESMLEKRETKHQDFGIRMMVNPLKPQVVLRNSRKQRIIGM